MSTVLLPHLSVVLYLSVLLYSGWSDTTTSPSRTFSSCGPHTTTFLIAIPDLIFP